ncbi:MAG TPA: hypothetical protein VD968_10820 [Pyrinomonadaceae bacterium]|nr:hypothetical protein [Pyrinomonadaceae bacterium]
MTPRPTLKSLAMTLALLVLSATAAAQLPEVKKETEEEKAKARKELERKALSLLDETLLGVQTLKLGENRAAIRTQAADLLWRHDEKRARSLFRDALNDFIAARGADGSKRERGWVLVQLRSHILYTAGARDPQLALELLRDSRPPAEDSDGALWGDPEQELRLEQSILSLAAETDPKEALRMAQESLSKGVTFGVLGMLERLRRRDADAGTKLAGDIVAKLRSENLTARPEATMVAVTLLRNVLVPQAAELFFSGGPPRSGGAAEKPKPLVMTDGDVRDLADLVSAEALRNSPQGNSFGLLMQLQSLLPELEKRVPARAAQLRRRLAEMESTLDPRMRAWAQYDSLASRPPDAILEEAAKTAGEMRAELFKAAAIKLAQSGETERARQVIADNLRGQEREQMTSLIDQQEVARAVAKGDTEAARAVVSRIKSKERRAGAMADLAVAFALKGDRKTALQMLEEARGLIDRQPDNEREVEALLEVARGYALVEPAKTFELIDPLIDQANDMLAAVALLEKFGAGGGAFKKGEMILSPALDGVGGHYARYVKALGELARVDFDRTKAAADRFGRDEARIAARLVVARSVLSDKPEPAAAAAILASGGGHAVIISN